MIPTRVVKLLLVALSVSSTAQALQLPFRIGVPKNAIEKREPQATGDNTPQATGDASTTDITTTDETTPTPTPTPTDDDTTTPTPTTTPTTTRKEDPTSTPETTPTKTDETTTPKPTSNEEQTSAEESTTVGTTSTITTVITTTGSDGQESTSTQEIVSTGVATISKDKGSTSGMSTSTRNTIIGVVVGVGGAIILCTVGFVAWRIRNKKRKAEENDGLIGYGGYTAGAAEKPDSLTGGAPGGSQASRTPFQSTLESYHAPTQVNQASNF